MKVTNEPGRVEDMINNGIKGFRVTDITHHRNGVSGRGFDSVRFSCEMEGRFYPNMVAVVPYEAQRADARNPGTECFVLDLSQPTECWRGDNFFDLVKGVIDEQERVTLEDIGTRFARRRGA